MLEEVDKVVAEFKGMLTKSLESPSAQPAEVERTIKLLLELEPNSDPIWHYLQTQVGAHSRAVRSSLGPTGL